MEANLLKQIARSIADKVTSYGTIVGKIESWQKNEAELPVFVGITGNDRKYFCDAMEGLLYRNFGIETLVVPLGATGCIDDENCELAAR